MGKFYIKCLKIVLQRFNSVYSKIKLGQYSHPIFSKTGGYPKIMEEIVLKNSLMEGFNRSRLPTIDEDQKDLIRGTSDFFFLNYYTSAYVEPANITTAKNFPAPSFLKDASISDTQDDSWPVAASSWLRSVPKGLRGLLK